MLNEDVASEQIFRASVSLEHQVSKTFNFQLGYSHSRSIRTVRTSNINAPLGGTYNPAFPTSGVRPFGSQAGNIFQYQSNGYSRGESFYISANGKIAKKVDFWANYSLGTYRTSDSGTSGSPSRG